MTYWHEKTKTEIVVLSKDELKDLVREVFAELNIEQKASQNGWMNVIQAARYLGVSRSFASDFCHLHHTDLPSAG